VGSATFKWSKDGGTTFQQTGLLTSTSLVTLADGVSVSFQAGNLAGVNDFNLGDTFWIFAGPLRNQPVWFDLYVPMGTPAGNYTGTVTVTESGKPPTTLTVNLQVYGFAIPVSSSIPSYYAGGFQEYIRAHFLISWGPQIVGLGQLYGTACLINRVTCNVDVAPIFSFNANGTVNTANYSTFDQWIGPLADGTITPHGEQLTSLNQELPGGGSGTQTYFATQNQLAHLVTKGWRSRVFDYTIDEPNSSSMFQQLMSRASLIRSADPTFRSLVTTDVAQDNFNLNGYISRYVPTWTDLGANEFVDGPQAAARPAYDEVIMNGDDVWWYDACGTQGCGTQGIIPQEDNYPNSMADTSALMNRNWGIMSIVPYNVTGVLYYDSGFAFNQFYFMSPPRVDVWDSIYYFSGNGDGTFFYPGRPSVIGGTTDIPVESLRLKLIRDAFVDMEYALKLRAQGDGAFLATNVSQVVQDMYTYDANPATWFALHKTLGQKIK